MSVWLTELQIINELSLLSKAVGSDKKLAEKLGISPQYLSDILNGRRRVSQHIAKAIGFRMEPTFFLHCEYEGRARDRHEWYIKHGYKFCRFCGAIAYDERLLEELHERIAKHRKL